MDDEEMGGGEGRGEGRRKGKGRKGEERKGEERRGKKRQRKERKGARQVTARNGEERKLVSARLDLHNRSSTRTTPASAFPASTGNAPSWRYSKSGRDAESVTRENDKQYSQALKRDGVGIAVVRKDEGQDGGEGGNGTC